MADILDMSARVTRIPAPIASPGQCMICGKNEHPKGFAATDNLDIEFYGTIYFCADCVGDYARVFGFVSEEKVEELKQEVSRQAEELSLLRRSLVNLENVLDAYSIPSPNGVVLPTGDASDVSASEGVAEPLPFGEGQDVSEDSGVTVAVGSGEEQVTESASVEGTDDVRNVTSELDDLSAILDL